MIYYGEFDNIKGENFSVTIGTDGDKSLDYDIFHFNQLILDVVPSGDEIIEPLRYVFVSPKKRVVSTSARTSTSGTVISTKNESFQNWYIEDAPRWVSGVRETSDGFSFDFKYNILDVKRYGVVTLRQEESNKIIMVDVEQAQGDGNYEFSVDSTAINAPSSGETYTIGVTATIGGEDVPFEITYTSDFIHAEIVDGNIIVTVFENGGEERVGTIVIYQDDLDMEIIITVNQEGSQPRVLTRWVATTDVYCFDESEYIERWVDSGDYTCIDQSKYKVLVLEVSYDGGETWSTTEETKIGDLIESESVDCGYVPPIPTDCDTIYYTSTDGNIVTPYNGLTPTSNTYDDGLGTMIFDDCIEIIPIDAFYHCTNLTSVIMPNSVTSIGNYAFFDCFSLTSVTIPNSVTSISEGVFRNCSSLSSVTIPYSVTSINYDAFHYCSSLTSVTIPNSVTTIGEGAFGYCERLSSVTIGNSVTSIGDSAFERCYGLTSIEIPSSVETIGDWAFEYCSSLTSVTIHDGVTSIGEQAFWSGTSLTSIEIPNSVTSIGDEAFSNCYSLTRVNSNVEGECIIPNSVTRIGHFTFHYCSGLTSVTMGSGVTSIGMDAFGDCRSLTRITIPNSVTSISMEAFQYCTSLSSVTYNGTIAQWNAISKGKDWKYKVPPTCRVHCTDGDISI